MEDVVEDLQALPPCDHMLEAIHPELYTVSLEREHESGDTKDIDVAKEAEEAMWQQAFDPRKVVCFKRILL